MGRFVTLDGAPTGPAIHVVDPGVPLEQLIVDPLDVWRTQPSVRKVVDFIARNLASIPLHVYRHGANDSRERVRDGGLAGILAEPAPFTTPYRFWHTIHVDGLIFDRWAFVRLEADDEGPEMLFRLPPGRFRIERGTYNEPKALIVWPKDGDEYQLPPEVAVFDAGYASAWSNVTPPIDALADTLYEASEARKYRRELLQRGARVDAVIERPADQKWDDAAWARFKSQFAKYRAGGGEEGGVPILEDGMKYVKVEAFSPQTLETLEARKLTDSEVASFFHVPPEMVGARDGTYSNLDAFRQMLWNVTLGPRIVAWEQALNVMLRPMYGRAERVYVEAHVDSKLRGSFIEQAQAMQSSVGAPIMTRNEARKMRNLPAVEGGDELITPLNVLVGGLASPRDTAPKGEPAGKARRSGVKATRPDLPTAEQERELFAARIEEYWLGAGAVIAEELDLNAKAIPDVAGVYDIDSHARAVEPIIRAHMARLAEIGAWDVLADWDPDSESWAPEMVEAWIARAAETNATRWSSGMFHGLVAAVTGQDPEGSLMTFLTTAALAVAIAGAFASEAQSFGGWDAAKKSGLGTKTWHVRSRNPRASHAAQDGETVPIDDVFSNGLRWPGDHFGDASENVNCTCELTYGKG